MTNKALGVDDWAVQIYKPLPSQIDEVREGRNHEDVEEYITEVFEGTSCREIVQYITKLRVSTSDSTDDKIEALKNEITLLKEKISVLEAFLGIRSTKTPHILHVAKIFDNTWITDGLLVKTHKNGVKVKSK